MKITFNELGVLIDTITDDESYRQGNVGNTLTAVFEGKNANEHIATIVYTRPDGSKIARLPLTLIGSDSYQYTFNDAWFMAISGIATLTIYLHDSRGNIVANGQVQFNIEKADTTDITTITPDELSEWIQQLANKVDINSTEYIHVKNLTDINIDEIANDTIIATINENSDVDFYKNQNGVLVNINHFRYLNYYAGQSEFVERKIYYGTIVYPNSLLSTGTQYIGWRVGSQHTFVANGKIYTTDANLTSGYVTINEEIATKLTTLTNLLVTDNMKVNGKIYLGEADENNEVLNRGEIKEEFVEQVKTGTAPRVYGVDSNDEQVMYEVRNQTIPNSIVQRDANGRAYILTPTQPSHIANKGYVDGEITTLRDESMNYTDDEITGAIAGLKDESGKIRSDLLPSYVDDVVEYSNRNLFPTTGERGKIYVDTSTNESYRWSGTQYIELMSGDYYLRANGEKLELDLEKLEKVTPTDIVADGNTIKLYHDSTEITGQEIPVTFKTINGVSVIGVGDIETDNIQVLDTNFDLQTLVPLFTDLSDLNNNITDYATLQDRIGFVKILGADSVKMQFFVGLKDSEDETAGTITYKLYQASCVINGNVVEDWTIDYENKSNSVYVDLTNNVLYRAMEFVEVPYYTYERNIDTLMVLLAKEINEELLRKLMESKADTDGYYPQMRVGLSDNLYSPDGVVEETPYTFRETAGTLNVETGNAEIQSVKGNTIVWNLMSPKEFVGLYITETNHTYENGITNSIFSPTKNNIRFTSSYPLKANHKYLARFYVKINKDVTFLISAGSQSYDIDRISVKANVLTDISTIIYRTTDDSVNSVWITLYNLTLTENYEISIYNYGIVDLTLMGKDDYYTTAEQFRQDFPRLDYEANPGELKSVNVTGIKTVGFNAFDGELEVGGINTSTGENAGWNNAIRSKNFIKVVGGKQYTLYRTSALSFGLTSPTIYTYDSDYKYIKTVPALTTTPDYQTFDIPANASYVKIIYGYSDNVADFVDKVKIAFHLTHTGYKNGTHEPYWTETRYIDNALELRSAGSAYDELTKDKKITRIGSVDLGTLNWYNEDLVEGRWRSDDTKNYIAGMSDNYIVGNILCPKYISISNSSYSNGVIGVTVNRYGALRIFDTNFTTSQQVQQALSGVLLYYELADYVEEPLPLQNLTYKVDDFGTEEWLQTSDIPVPVAHSTLYMRNLRDDVRTLPTTYATKEELGEKIIEVSNQLIVDKTEGITTNILKIDNWTSGTLTGGGAHYNLANGAYTTDLLDLKAGDQINIQNMKGKEFTFGFRLCYYNDDGTFNNRQTDVWRSFPYGIPKDGKYKIILFIEADFTIDEEVLNYIKNNFTITQQRTNEVIEVNNLNITDKPYYTKIAGYTRELVYEKTHTDSVYMQGGTTDGTYIYYAKRYSDTNIHLYKVDIATMSVVLTNTNLALGHANDMCYYNGYLYVCRSSTDTKAELYKIDTETLTLVETINIKNVYDYLYEKSGSGIGNITYHPKLNLFIMGHKEYIVFTDTNFKVIKGLSLYDIEGKLQNATTGPSLEVWGDYFIRAFGVYDSAIYKYHNYIDVFDWNGKHIQRIYSVESGNELENVINVNGIFYIGYAVDGTKEQYYKMTITATHKVSYEEVAMKFNPNN